MKILICGVSAKEYGHDSVEEVGTGAIRVQGLKESIETIFSMYFWKTLHKQTVIYDSSSPIKTYIDASAAYYGWTVIPVPKEEDESVESHNQRLIDERPNMVLYFVNEQGKGVPLRWVPHLEKLVNLAKEEGIPAFSGRLVANDFNYEGEWEQEEETNG